MKASSASVRFFDSEIASMSSSRTLHGHFFRTLTSHFLSNHSRNVGVLGGDSIGLIPRYEICAISAEKLYFFPSSSSWNHFTGCRWMSTSKGRSMRSKVEARMRKESGKTLREIRRAHKIQKKLMTDEERHIYNLKRAKKKVALLLQKLKKYELPELPTPRHDPELLTAEQIQAYKKIGFRNKNYVPVGVRGVFGGVVQNMHMHWKFHETVQVCCDNFPKEKIKEMATMLARLSGGIVVNIHNVKTIIMFRGRNYRQPKNLIPINTLTKRKALFKARFEQALDAQKLNIKKIEQQLRKMNINPDDPVAMASIQRVASTFFNAIDRKQGTPYVFSTAKLPAFDSSSAIDSLKKPEKGEEDSDQEELDKFIAEIEEAADKEWEAEEEADREEAKRIRYRNREFIDGRLQRSEMSSRIYRKNADSDDGEDYISDEDETEDEDKVISGDDDDSQEDRYENTVKKVQRRGGGDENPKNENWRLKMKTKSENRREMAIEDSEPEDMLEHLDDVMFESEGEEEDNGLRKYGGRPYDYGSTEDEEPELHASEVTSYLYGSKEENDESEHTEGGRENKNAEQIDDAWESD